MTAMKRISQRRTQRINPPTDLQSPDWISEDAAQALEGMAELWTGRKQKLPLYVLLATVLNLVLAPLVYAATDGALSRAQSWALGLLGVATVALSIYLFFVMFVPERF
jgi:F subunit of K+-transporting ATPase (Potass_KdpF)